MKIVSICQGKASKALLGLSQAQQIHKQPCYLVRICTYIGFLDRVDDRIFSTVTWSICAAARRRQPFLMHKMAFHRARILSIIECTSDNTSSGLDTNEVKFVKGQTLIALSDSIAPPLKPSRAEVFLPYSLPGEQLFLQTYERLPNELIPASSMWYCKEY